MSQESDIALKMIYASLSSNGFYILRVSVVSVKEGEKEKASIMAEAPRPVFLTCAFIYSAFHEPVYASTVALILQSHQFETAEAKF